MQSDSSDAALQSWARQVTVAVNVLHPMSTFSRATPESFETATPGTLGRNLASSSSVMWIKQAGSGTTGWVAIA